jgi:hypothetical protein
MVVENNIRFDEITKHNDVTFSYLIGLHASKIKADDRALYCVTTRRSSLTYSGFTAAQRLEHIRWCGQYNQFLLKNEINLKEESGYLRQLLYFFLHEREKCKEAIKILTDLSYSKFYITMKVAYFAFQCIIVFPLKLIKKVLRIITRMKKNGVIYTIGEIRRKLEKRLERQ